MSESELNYFQKFDETRVFYRIVIKARKPSRVFKTAKCISVVTYEKGLTQLRLYSMHMSHRYVWD